MNPETRPITWRVNAILLTLATVFLSACDPQEPRTIGVSAKVLVSIAFGAGFGLVAGAVATAAGTAALEG